MDKSPFSLSKLYSLGAVVLLVSAYLLYLLIRGFDPLTGSVTSTPLTLELPAFLENSYVSFAHVLALSLLSYVILGIRQKTRFVIAAFWGVLNIGFEYLQIKNDHGYSYFGGTFDVGDLIAIVLAVVVFCSLTYVIEARYSVGLDRRVTRIPWLRGALMSLVIPFGLGSIIASSAPDAYVSYEPVYLSYEELRGSIKLEQGRGLRESGKIYLYNNLLLVSEPNKGIHIYDNTDRTAPVHLVFINLPGNLDIAVRDGYLYADSFIDLVVIDINDLNNIVYSHRVESVFPYDPFQAIDPPEGVYLDWDKRHGVIIDYKVSGDTIQG